VAEGDLQADLEVAGEGHGGQDAREGCADVGAEDHRQHSLQRDHAQTNHGNY